MFKLFKRKSKKQPLEEITFKLLSNDFQDNIKSLQKFQNPTYKLSKKDFINEATDGVAEWEFVFEDKDPHIEDQGSQITVYVSNVPVGIIKKGSMSRYRNLVKSERINSIYVALNGGRYKEYTSYIDRNDKEQYDFDSDITEYSADLYVSAFKTE